jgi:hypothetical protein
MQTRVKAQSPDGGENADSLPPAGQTLITVIGLDIVRTYEQSRGRVGLELLSHETSQKTNTQGSFIVHTDRPSGSSPQLSCWLNSARLDELDDDTHLRFGYHYSALLSYLPSRSATPSHSQTKMHGVRATNERRRSYLMRVIPMIARTVEIGTPTKIAPQKPTMAVL